MASSSAFVTRVQTCYELSNLSNPFVPLKIFSPVVPKVVQEDVEDHNVIEQIDGSDDDELLTGEYDSDESPKSHEARKKNRWYCDFFKL
ncbi:hypothetical protein L1887_39077 [Cichorium endivia]|nr:hypothetical protein L1887_39069 [Cichorium endivia]KAI3496698.1 hypothetical protein L1887_39070 [Cichorium endivia]KAI3496703.1 hypothetical protein L1887_39076 [Cichorium endivia]KAI3496704.1 hypothetical protein L1887_39077 [Cichorium endivia]